MKKLSFSDVITSLVSGAFLLLTLAKFLLEVRREWFNMLPAPRNKRDWFIIPVLLLACGAACGQDESREEYIRRAAQHNKLEDEARQLIKHGMDREAVNRKLQRDRVLLEVGVDAERMMKVYGDPAIAMLRSVSVSTVRSLVELFETGQLKGVDFPRVIVVINRPGHGEPVAAWVCNNHHRLRDQGALMLWEANTLDYVFDLRVLEDDVKKMPVTVPKDSPVEGVKAWLMDDGNWPLMGGVILVMGIIAYLKKRKSRGPGAPASNGAVADLLGKPNSN